MELQHCPVCGELPELQINEMKSGHYAYTHQCDNFYIETRHWRMIQQEAISDWNTNLDHLKGNR